MTSLLMYQSELPEEFVRAIKPVKNHLRKRGFKIMSDLERLVELYKSFGIELDVVESDDVFLIELEARTHEKIIGYVKEGKFILQWIGE